MEVKGQGPVTSREISASELPELAEKRQNPIPTLVAALDAQFQEALTARDVPAEVHEAAYYAGSLSHKIRELLDSL